MNREFRKLEKRSIGLPDGRTIETGYLKPVTTGWAVGLKGATNFEGEEGFFLAFAIADLTTRTIGKVFDEELEFWEVVMIFEDEESATEAGHDQDQLSIYHIDSSRVKWLV
jgi:hypothetical protein